ncbi:MAG: DUF6152 family protein [Caulobacteraceae bacterium]
MKNLPLTAVTALAICAVNSTALAHHSFAMFDNTRKIDVKGTVKELQWTNPHVWLEMVVTENGQQKTYDFEGGAVAVLKKFGWTKDTVKAGDTITLTAHPFKDGKAGGSIDFVTLADGRKIGGGDGIPGAVVVGAK